MRFLPLAFGLFLFAPLAPAMADDGTPDATYHQDRDRDHPDPADARRRGGFGSSGSSMSDADRGDHDRGDRDWRADRAHDRDWDRDHDRDHDRDRDRVRDPDDGRAQPRVLDPD